MKFDTPTRHARTDRRRDAYSRARRHRRRRTARRRDRHRRGRTDASSGWRAEYAYQAVALPDGGEPDEIPDSLPRPGHVARDRDDVDSTVLIVETLPDTRADEYVTEETGNTAFEHNDGYRPGDGTDLPSHRELLNTLPAQVGRQPWEPIKKVDAPLDWEPVDISDTHADTTCDTSVGNSGDDDR